MTAIVLVAITLFTPALFQTPELLAFRDFTEDVSERTEPLDPGERMELYDQVAFFYLSASGAAERVWTEEGARLEEELDKTIASLKESHKKRIIKGTQRIKRKKLSPQKRRAAIGKMKRASWQKYLADKKAAEEESAKKLAELQDDYWEATRELSNLQLTALQYIDTMPEKT